MKAIRGVCYCMDFPLSEAVAGHFRIGIQLQHIVVAVVVGVSHAKTRDHLCGDTIRHADGHFHKLD